MWFIFRCFVIKIVVYGGPALNSGRHVRRATFDLHVQERLVGRAGAVLCAAHQQLPATGMWMSHAPW